MITTTFRTNSLTFLIDKYGRDSGPTTMFLHAGGETRDIWKPIAPSVTDAGWRVIAPDLRGHGQSEHVDAYFFDDFISDTEKIIQELADKPLVIVGGSLGGLVGLMIAGAVNSPVDGLILLDVPTKPSLAAANREKRKVAVGIARNLLTASHVDPKVISGTLVEEIVFNTERIRQAARKVNVPTLLVQGLRSAAVREAEKLAFKEDIPHGEIRTVDAGHLVAQEQPESVAATIKIFLTRYW